jgi:carbon storage regulator
MLVLTRKNHESVVVGDSSLLDQVLKVTVLDVKGDKVRLGFEIDKNVPVNRWEVWQRIRDARNSDGGDHSTMVQVLGKEPATC